MTLDPTLIAQINTPVHGASAADDTNYDGAPGLDAPLATLDVTGKSFFDPSAALELGPLVTGGLGGGGGYGVPGTTTPATTIDNSPSHPFTEIDYYAGGNAGPAGGGGTGGGATFLFANDTIGSGASPYGGRIDIVAQPSGGASNGGPGAGGDNGSSGGSGGGDEKFGQSPYYEINYGAPGGSGGNGGAAGDGGAATDSIAGLSEVSSGLTFIDLLPTAGYAGINSGFVTGGGSGGSGGDGSEPSNGGNGGFGGNGGTATANLANSNIVDTDATTIELKPTSGDGGGGGTGGPAGAGINAGDHNAGVPFTETTTYGHSGNGGAGGSDGLATASFTGNTLDTPSATLIFTATGGATGAGGASGPVTTYAPQYVDPSGDVFNYFNGAPGSNGAAGISVPAHITFTDNTIEASGYLGLTLHIQAASAGVNTVGRTLTLQPLSGGAGGNLTFSGNSLVGGGRSELDVSGAGSNATVDDKDGLLSIVGSPANSMTGFDDYVLATGDTFIRGTSLHAYVYVAPDPDTIVLTPGHGALTLEDTTATNTILQFQGYGAALDSLAQLEADTIQGSGVVTIDVPGDGAVTLGSSWSPSTSNTSFTAACFVAGTRIMTSRGKVAVERLAEGDRVRTVSGEDRTVIWIGHRRIACHRHPEPEKVWPVRIAAGAFDNGLPARDLWLSPDHAVFFDGVLIPIRYFINGATVAQHVCKQVIYYHVELERHEVMLAEGVAVESYLDTGNRGAFDNGGGAMQLHADFALKVWAAEACAPLVVGGPVLATQRKKILARAGALGNRLSADPRLRVQADGRNLKLRRIGASMLAKLPAGTRELRLVSRSTVPAWTLPDSDDHRRLGVAVTALRLDDADLADAAFGAGWHAREPGLRWTDGDAVLAVNGGGTLAIRLAPLLRYWVQPRRDLPERAPAAMHG